MRTFKQIITIKNNYLDGFFLPKEFNTNKVEVIIRTLDEQENKKTIKLSDKYKNVFTKEDAKSFDTYTKENRTEWDSIS